MEHTSEKELTPKRTQMPLGVIFFGVLNQRRQGSLRLDRTVRTARETPANSTHLL
jgi:hypothetical protein